MRKIASFRLLYASRLFQLSRPARPRTLRRYVPSGTCQRTLTLSAQATPVLVTDAGTVEVFQTSRAGDKVTDKGALPVYSPGERGALDHRPIDHPEANDPRIRRSDHRGGRLRALGSPPATRQAALDAYFSPSGSGYTLARTHIASCDFSLASYQYSTTPDPTLPDFSIAHDEAVLIPAIKDAIASSGGALKILASPWSAPAWMKSPAALYIPPTAANGYSGTDPVLQTQYYDAYALYLSKYIQAYKGDGINIWAITPQNEPLGNGGNWETMAGALTP